MPTLTPNLTNQKIRRDLSESEFNRQLLERSNVMYDEGDYRISHIPRLGWVGENLRTGKYVETASGKRFFKSALKVLRWVDISEYHKRGGV